MCAEKKVTRKKPISESKIKIVEEISEKIKSVRTTLLASCKNLPGEQFHEIKKSLRGKAEIKVAKKNIINRSIDNIEKGYIKNLKKELKSDIVIFFSDLDPFELSALLSENQSPAKARYGDIAPEDIEIEPGPTELIPGPAISELSGVGLKVKVKEGKLEIMKGAVVAKKGEKITSGVANVLGKLNMKPMKVGFIPIAAYDSKDDKVYLGIKINKEETLETLKEFIKKALGFAINIDYTTKETISYFIAKASAEEKALGKLVDVEGKAEEVGKAEEKPVEGKAEIKVEEKPEEVKEKVEEEKKEDLNNKEKTEN